MADLGKAYVQIIPSASGIKGAITKELSGEAKSAGKSAGESVGNGLVGSLKKIILAAGLGAMIKQSLDAGGAIQQSFGGLDTLYGEASDAAKKYAVEAAKAGISANNYAEQAVSFGAALKQAFSGDVAKAAEAANTAILDMADNSAKFGTDLAAVQTAYQGFAKQNYTMLDNLKLGYGGTKTEMERLLKDAKELSGIEYNIDNLGDVYEAIHVIQTELGVAGVAADEAKETFTGSANAMKAAFTNLLADISLGNDISASMSTLVENTSNFLFSNLLPMIDNIVSQVPSVIVQAVKGIAEYADEIVNSGVYVVSELVKGLLSALPELIGAVGTLIEKIMVSFGEIDWQGIADDMIGSLDTGLLNDLPQFIATIGEVINKAIDFIVDNLPSFIDKGIEFVSSMASGIKENLPTIITAAGDMVSSVLDKLLKSLPQLLEKGLQLVGSLASGMLQALPSVISAIFEVIKGLLSTLVSNMPELLQKGFELIGELISGIIKAIPDVLKAVAGLVSDLLSGFKVEDFIQVGYDMLMGIKDGIGNAIGGVVSSAKEAAANILGSVKNFFGIRSPSTIMAKEVGRWLPAGIAEGVTDNMKPLTEAMEDLAELTVLDANQSINTALQDSANKLTMPNTISNNNALISRIDAMLYLMQEYYPDMAKGIDGNTLAAGIDRSLGLSVV